ncbi:alpha/beta fold hydrolase [Kitasatospora sp. NPDC101155]|uniref:alpha/beta fold hydrolase n=1 Tax=Kitasatospora sp. NPDC101155 TaxID=3364097 RepID=UPI0038121EA6
MERTIQKTVAVSPDSWVTIDVYGDADAPGLVMVPGVMSDAHTWRHVAREIHAWPSVAVVNRRGRVPSGPLTRAYALQTEIADLVAVLNEIQGAEALFGWSYGGLIALMAAGEHSVKQVIAYEPVIRPFARDALPALAAAADDRDWDRSVEIVNMDISGFRSDHVEALRADRQGWSMLRRLSEPLHAELAALNASPAPEMLAQRADHTTLIIGEANIGSGPYGTAFESIRRRLDQPCIQVLPGQGHLAHIHAPTELAGLIDSLAGC